MNWVAVPSAGTLPAERSRRPSLGADGFAQCSLPVCLTISLRNSAQPGGGRCRAFLLLLQIEEELVDVVVVMMR